MTMRQPKCGTDARCEGYWTDFAENPQDDVPELVSGDSLIILPSQFLECERPAHNP